MTAVRGWAVASPTGEIVFKTISRDQESSWMAAQIWAEQCRAILRKNGYRCIPVTIQEARHDER